MSNTLIDVNDDDLKAAMAFYGTTTKKDTINRALKDAADKRRAQFAGLRQLFAESRAEFERMSPEERARELERLTPTDEKFEHQVGMLDAPRKPVD